MCCMTGVCRESQNDLICASPSNKHLHHVSFRWCWVLYSAKAQMDRAHLQSLMGMLLEYLRTALVHLCLVLMSRITSGSSANAYQTISSGSSWWVPITLDCGILYHKDLQINARLVLYYIAVVLKVIPHDLPEAAKVKFELRLLIN